MNIFTIQKVVDNRESCPAYKKVRYQVVNTNPMTQSRDVRVFKNFTDIYEFINYYSREKVIHQTYHVIDLPDFVITDCRNEE